METTEMGDRWNIVRRRVLDMGLTPNAATVFAYIVEYKSRNDGNHPSVRTIANDLEISVFGTWYVLQKLSEAGLLRYSEDRKHIFVTDGEWVFNLGQGLSV